MVTPVLPALAVAALTDHAGTDRGLLVAPRTGKTLHLLLDTGRALTPTGLVRRNARPHCGRRPRSWRPVEVDGRPLCRTCARVLRKQYGPATLAVAATWLQPADFARTLQTARDEATVKATIAALLESGLTGKTVLVDGRSFRLTALVAQARSRLSKGHQLTDADLSRFSYVKNAPARRFPRRVS